MRWLLLPASDVAPASNWVICVRCPLHLRLLRQLSRRNLAGLYTARHRVTQELVALKYWTAACCANVRRAAVCDRKCVCFKWHATTNLLQLHEVTSTGTRVELAFELARASRAKQTAQGLQFLHEQGSYTRSAAEHLLFSDDEPDARNGLKLEDDGKRLVTNWREAQQVDVWALGVHAENNVAGIERRVLQDKLTFPEDGTLLSRAARDLLRRLLEKNPDAAMSIEEVAAHPWLYGGVALLSAE
ncbi:Protein kinase-like domain [Phytophthora cactorum]|nr:Protein kinase-like domain [Phytophthora cactorum]